MSYFIRTMVLDSVQSGYNGSGIDRYSLCYEVYRSALWLQTGGNHLCEKKLWDKHSGLRLDIVRGYIPGGSDDSWMTKKALFSITKNEWREIQKIVGQKKVVTKIDAKRLLIGYFDSLVPA